jgi:hypothetical protein
VNILRKTHKLFQKGLIQLQKLFPEEEREMQHISRCFKAGKCFPAERCCPAGKYFTAKERFPAGIYFNA